ncbi:UNVERIFIED_CONTAM: protein TORNADO 2 [Sesamum radiatum]|uniref:Protein TORNADO 2 n=1 Tax=Sesamum radiatum TaxID=300843 RepID=A0AAW2TX67_SESRA
MKKSWQTTSPSTGRNPTCRNTMEPRIRRSTSPALRISPFSAITPLGQMPDYNKSLTKKPPFNFHSLLILAEQYINLEEAREYKNEVLVKMQDTRGRGPTPHHTPSQNKPCPRRPTSRSAFDSTQALNDKFISFAPQRHRSHKLRRHDLIHPIIGAGIWLATQADNSCLKILQWPVIILGVLILVVALAGFIGGFWRIPWLLIFYLIAMLVLIVLLACLVVFVYMVTIRGSGHPAPSRAYLEYSLDDFSGWLRRRVRSSYKWDRIRSCLSSTSMCAELNQSYRMAQDFFNARISPLQVRPLAFCGYVRFLFLSFFLGLGNFYPDPTRSNLYQSHIKCTV